MKHFFEIGPWRQRYSMIESFCEWILLWRRGIFDFVLEGSEATRAGKKYYKIKLLTITIDDRFPKRFE